MLRNSLLLIGVLSSFCTMRAIGQSSTNVKVISDYSTELMSSTYLEGLAEPLLIGGRPAVRISNRKGQRAEVSIQTRDGEDALVFDVIRLKWQMPTGRLFVTKTKLIFMPSEGNDDFLKVERNEVHTIKLRKKWRLGGIPNVNIEYKGGDKTIVAQPFDIGDRDSTMAVNAFLGRAISDFEGTMTEFKNLTRSVQPEGQESEEVAEDLEISHRYDRFKDKTVVKTPRVLLQGTKRTLRLFTELWYEGKSLEKLERIDFLLAASNARPMFKEDSLDLNILIDGDRMSLGRMKIISDENTKTLVKQTLSMTMPADVYSKIAVARLVEFQIGNLEYTITESQLRLFKDALQYTIKD